MTSSSNLPLTHHFARLSELSMHYVTAGSGPPLVLLHGFPQSWYEWREIIPALAKHYFVVAPDLRGLGDSGRPASGYDKATVAEDVWELLNKELGITTFNLVGHDWGGPTAFALAAQHRDAVRALAILDVTIPGDGSDVFSTSQGRWHHGFHSTLDLPEALVHGRERIYVSWFCKNFASHQGAISEAAIDEYARTYAEPGAMRAGFNYYRAIPQDSANTQRFMQDGKLKMPVLAVGGGQSFGRRELVFESLRRVAENVTGHVVDSAGHFIPEEAPDALIELLMDFFDAAP
ncbi:MAG: alpha/beta hydrolase [Gammaproteobacteria bacterium]|nr:alpha/beta hydrolase [Gammaproteobacteria bacterium]